MSQFVHRILLISDDGQEEYFDTPEAAVAYMDSRDLPRDNYRGWQIVSATSAWSRYFFPEKWEREYANAAPIFEGSGWTQ